MGPDACGRVPTATPEPVGRRPGPTGADRPARRSGSGSRRVLAVLLLAIAWAVVAVWVETPSVAGVRARVDGLGRWAPVAFAAGYALSALLPLPKAVLSVTAGVVFGLGLGTAVVLSGALAGALLAFALARRLGRDWVQRRTGPRAAAVLQRLGAGPPPSGRPRAPGGFPGSGLVTVVVLRLVPLVPYTALNLACGVSPVRVRDYAAGTLLGMVPGTLVAVSLGARGDEPGSALFLTAAGAAVLLAVGALVVARRLDRRPDHPQGGRRR